MIINKREQYLENVKNNMLFHCNQREIYLILEDLNSYFNSGIAEGKTEETLCGNLGSPAKLAADILHGKPNNRYRLIRIAHIVSLLLLCILGSYTVRYPNPLLSCIMVFIIPVFLWYSFGGYCLFQIRKDTTKISWQRILFSFASALMIAQQLILILVCNKIITENNIVIATYYTSRVLIIVSILLLFAIAYKLYKGYYLLFGSLITIVGVIWSSILCNYILLHLTRTGASFSVHMVCIMPFAVSVILRILLLPQTKKEI